MHFGTYHNNGGDDCEHIKRILIPNEFLQVRILDGGVGRITDVVVRQPENGRYADAGDCDEHADEPSDDAGEPAHHGNHNDRKH